jgi:hypothetical protein
VTDQLGDDVANQRPHRRDNLARGLHATGRAVTALLGGFQQRDRILRPLAIHVSGISGPRRDICLHHAGQVLADAAQLGGDVLPGLRLRRDLVSVAGQPVKRFLERPDVLDQPADTGGEDRPEGVHGHREGVERGAHCAHRD